MFFPVVMYGCESWTVRKLSTEELMLLNMLEKTLESPLDSKEIKSLNPKGNQPWTFIGRTDAEAPILWPPDAKSWLIGKDLDAGKAWGQKENRETEDEMLDGITNSVDMKTWANVRRWWGTEKPGVLQSMGSQRIGNDLVARQHHHLGLPSKILI